MTLDYSNYKHISFDLWLTLIRSNPNFKKRRDVVFRDFFEIDASIEKVNEVIRYYDVFCNNLNEKTGLNIDTFEIYYLILNALNVSINKIEIAKLSLFYKESELLFMDNKPELIFPNTSKLFSEMIANERTLSILSNTAFIKGETLRKLMAFYELDNYFSFQIYSDETGFSKPNFKMFDLVFEQVKRLKPITKKQIVHVGDNRIADFEGAVNFGFDAILI